MNIALLNTRITLQRQVVTTDKIGNHTNAWTDAFSCYATLAGESGSESLNAGTENVKIDCTFTIRWSSEVANITADDYRVIYNGEVFDIQGIDHMSNTRKCIKLKCTKKKR